MAKLADGAAISCIVGDRFRHAEFREAMAKANLRVPFIWRGFGWKDGSEDIERFRRALFDGQVKTLPSGGGGNSRHSRSRAYGRASGEACEGGAMGIARPGYDRHGQAVYRSPRWGRVRFLIRRRDQWRCVQCGARGCRLEVDHIRPIREAPELAYDMGNLQTLCVSCHSRKTQKEVGFYAEMKPERQAWRNLVRELARPYRAKETANA